MLSESSSRQVQSVEKAFRIITFLQNHDGGSIERLASELDLAKSTVHNYLGTLQTLGYVVEREGTYHLGLRFLTHGMAAKSSLAIGETVAQALTDVAAEYSQPIWWIVEEYGRGLFVDCSSATGDGDGYGRIGKRSYLHTHAPGKAILAQFSDETVREIAEYHGLVTLTRETVTDLEALLEELATIREQGFAVSNGEAALGIQSVGVAFDGPAGYTHGLGIFDSTHNISGRGEEQLHQVLQETAASIQAETIDRGV